MKNSILVMAVFLAVTCSHAIYAEETVFAIDIVSSSKVRFHNVSIEYDEGIPVLLGKVKRSVYNSRVSPGHVDYIVKDAKGNVLMEGGAEYSPSLSLRRWKFGSSFAIALPENLPADALIQVGFHRNTHTPQKFSPVASHTANKLL
jgi:hypothetical protein